jgi:transcription-repair coupling factor (superfamily II helicase)
VAAFKKSQTMQTGKINVNTENIFPIIKKFLYSDHEIFLRELVSNAVDASQKIKTLASAGEFTGELGDLKVEVKIDKDAKTITISDRGIGMSAEEIDKYINQIAFSGAEEFVQKYSGKEGTAPSMDRLGSPAWQNLKQKTKAKVKTIAFDLIKLYAKRKSTIGHAYPPDSYLQMELEASFMYEDTPDQAKAITAVKQDMESPSPMDRLVCGDVGFGKTEVAMRAAFKAATDGKQVAVLVPTTILALQHYKSFAARFRDFPVTVDHISRLPPVGIDQTTTDTHRCTIIALPLAFEQFRCQRFEASVDRSLESGSSRFGAQRLASLT